MRCAPDAGDAASVELLPARLVWKPMPEMSDADLLDRFEQRTLPHEEWNHRAHVRVAFLYLRRLGLDRAIRTLRSGIRAYNAAVGIQESPTNGYHETITKAFATIVHAALADLDPTELERMSSDEFCDDHPGLLDKHALSAYYSSECLAQPEAKRSFVEPDLAPLPHPGRTPRPMRGETSR